RDKQLMRLKDEVLDLEDFNESVALNEFTLDDFRMDLSNYVEANRAKLQDAPYGLYGVVPASTEHASVTPGVIYCLRQQASTSNSPKGQEPSAQAGQINPLSPYFLVYIQSDGTVRYNFTAPKQVLEIFRALCQGKTEPYAELCKLFDAQTRHGQDMTAYSALLDKAVAAIAAQFSRKNAANLFTGRGGKLMDTTKTVKSNNDFELVTWLVIK
ncbi:MAG: ATP-dependent helicase, partial [Polaromonas sp.]